MYLKEICVAIEDEMANFDFVDQWMAFELQGLELDYISSEKSKYYRAIQAFGKVFRGKRFCDLGTWWGLSACAAYGSFQTIDTFEIEVKQIKNVEALKKRCHLNLLREPKHCLEINFAPYDLVLVDVSAEGDFGDGEMESLLHERLVATGNCIAMYDDIDLSEGTRKFWESIKDKDKISIPDWHNSTWHDPSIVPGFGVVDYRRS